MNAWDCHVYVSMYIHMYVYSWSVDSREIVFTDKQELPNSRLLPYIGTLRNFSTYYFSTYLLYLPFRTDIYRLILRLCFFMYSIKRE